MQLISYHSYYLKFKMFIFDGKDSWDATGNHAAGLTVDPSLSKTGYNQHLSLNMLLYTFPGEEFVIHACTPPFFCSLSCTKGDICHIFEDSKCLMLQSLPALIVRDSIKLPS